VVLLLIIQVTSFSSLKILPQKYTRQLSLRAVSSNTENNRIITFAEKAFVTLSILVVGYEVFSKGENIKTELSTIINELAFKYIFAHFPQILFFEFFPLIYFVFFAQSVNGCLTITPGSRNDETRSRKEVEQSRFK